MAQIYKNQLMWKSEGQHKFKGDPIKDYIGDGLRNVAGAAQQATDMINRIKDEEAAGKMETAAQAAQNYIDNFQDFAGDNYLGLMEQEALKIWDDAFSTLDSATQTRFLFNNPEARDIFALKVAAAATEKTYDHAKLARKNSLVKDAKNVILTETKDGRVVMKTPDAIKMSAEEYVNDLQQNGKFRPEDATELTGEFWRLVGRGSIATAVGEGRLQEANNLLHDPLISSYLTPEEVAGYQSNIQGLLERQIEKEQQLAEARKKAGAAALEADLRWTVNTIFSDKNLSDEEKFRKWGRFMTALSNGEVDTLNEMFLGPDYKSYVGNFTKLELQAAINEAWKAAKLLPAVAETLGDLKLNVETFYGRYVKEDALMEDIPSSDLYRMNSLMHEVQDLYYFDPELVEMFEGIRNVVEAKKQIYLTSAKPSFFSSVRNQMRVQNRLGVNILGFGTMKQAETFEKEWSDLLQPGRLFATPTDGSSTVGYSKELAQKAKNAVYRPMHFGWYSKDERTSGWSAPTDGTYEEGINLVGWMFLSSPNYLKKAMGMEHVTDEAITSAILDELSEYNRLGKLRDFVDNSNRDKPVFGPIQYPLADPTVPIDGSEYVTLFKDIAARAGGNLQKMDEQALYAMANLARRTSFEHSDWNGLRDWWLDIDASDIAEDYDPAFKAVRPLLETPVEISE